MKHITSLIIASTLSLSVFAEKPAFSGFYFGGELASVKQEFSVPYSKLHVNADGNFVADGSRGTRVGVVTGYGFDYGANFVGLAEAKLSASNVKTKSELGTVTKEQFATSIAYLQGYRIADNFLPYIKVSVNASSFDVNNDAIDKSRYVQIENSGAYGIGFGMGLRYTVTKDFSIGAEYHKVTLRGQDNIRIKTNDINLIGAYRF